MQKISPSRRRFLAGAAACAVAPAFSLAGANPARMELTAGNSAHPLRGDDAPPVSLWTFNNASPGPLLRGRRGDSLRIRLVNKMAAAATSIHWHGVRVDNAMDGVVGVTQPAVSPGEFFDYEVALPDSGSFWYHSHNQSWEQVARGLYGPLLVEDPDDPPVDRDLVLMIDDWKMSPAGGLDEGSFGHLGEWSHGGRLGNWLTVNSVPEPTYEVPAGGRVRLRLMNPANARIFRLGLPPQMEAKIVALDGMPIAPRDFPADGLTLAPAQRADVVSDLPQSPGAHVLTALFGRGQSATAATLKAVAAAGGEKLAEKTAWPSPPKPVLPTRENAVSAVVHMIGGAMGGMRGAMMGGKMLSMRDLAQQRKLWAFNDQVGGHELELLRLRPGQTGILRVENDTAWPHAMHLHGHHFVPVPAGPAAEGGGEVWRDTHLLERGAASEYVFVGGKPGKWLFHCHMLEHMAAGMAGVVIVA